LATGSLTDINIACAKAGPGPNSLAVVQKLVAAGADTAAKATKSTTPLTVATLVNAPDIVSFMTAHR
jgi:ankyrin repeat protein